MAFDILLLLIICGIFYCHYYNNKQKIIERYGKPKDFFIVSSLNFQFRPSAINPTIIAIYNNKILISIGSEKFFINKENFVSFEEPTFFKPCSIKFKVDSVYKTRSIRFSIISKKQVNKVKDVLNQF